MNRDVKGDRAGERVFLFLFQEFVILIPPGQFYQTDTRGPNTFEGRADQFWTEVTGQEQPDT